MGPEDARGPRKEVGRVDQPDKYVSVFRPDWRVSWHDPSSQEEGLTTCGTDRDRAHGLGARLRSEGMEEVRVGYREFGSTWWTVLPGDG